MEACHTEAEHVYVVTLSSHLSGSYNSAVLGKNLYLEKYGDKQIHVIDSASLSTGVGLLVIKAAVMAQQGRSAEAVLQTGFSAYPAGIRVECCVGAVSGVRPRADGNCDGQAFPDRSWRAGGCEASAVFPFPRQRLSHTAPDTQQKKCRQQQIKDGFCNSLPFHPITMPFALTVISKSVSGM